MARKSRNPNFEAILQSLRNHSFDVAPSAVAAGGMLVSKYGAAAILVPAEAIDSIQGKGYSAAFAERPGVLVKGGVARLLDRGYQKFIQTPKFELPATAAQLHAIHRFSEELTQVTGGTSLYNESLGTTSDLYEYDRLKGREQPAAAPAQPWELTEGH